ncbi:MAG: metallophosphoesterase [Bacteroidota bacterium]
MIRSQFMPLRFFFGWTIPVILGITHACYTPNVSTANTQIAFIADVHLLDVHGALKDIGYTGVELGNGKNAIIRTMDAQMGSTRLFNENYFAFLAALDEIVKRGIKYVVLPGDFSDDGQPLNIQGLNKILKDYSANHGISFFAITGNHDPTRPFGDKGGKLDFLGKNGKAQPILSAPSLQDFDSIMQHPPLISEDIREAGYKEIINILGDHGFFPTEEYMFWATPFSSYSYEEYSMAKAREAAQFEQRQYSFDSSTRTLPDVSYLVEPVKDIWLLAIDANVYLPKKDGKGYQGTGIGYNRVVKHKKYLVNWVSQVVEEAHRLNKILVAFSHYPMVDFNDGAFKEIRKFFGDRAFQAHRIPKETVSEILANTGLKIHIAGHMHLNDTGIHRTDEGNTLINIQIPSLAAYPPAFKIMTIHSKDTIGVETVVLDSVPGFDTFFDLYKTEHSFVLEKGPETIWDNGILDSETYYEYTHRHLKNLVHQRFLQKEWPNGPKRILTALTGRQLLALAHIDNEFNSDSLEKVLQGDATAPAWQRALARADVQIVENGLKIDDFKCWKGDVFILALYELRSADKIALKEIGNHRMDQYLLITESILQNRDSKVLEPIRLFVTIFKKQLDGAPATNFYVHLAEGKIVPANMQNTSEKVGTK